MVVMRRSEVRLTRGGRGEADGCLQSAGRGGGGENVQNQVHHTLKRESITNMRRRERRERWVEEGATVEKVVR